MNLNTNNRYNDISFDFQQLIGRNESAMEDIFQQISGAAFIHIDLHLSLGYQDTT